MHLPLRFSWFYFFFAFSVTSFGQLKTGAEQLDQYLPDLENKKVALLVNQTSVINHTHLADTLIALGVDVIKIFAPEHGFRGNADAGEHVKDGIDKRTGVPIFSLYGANKKPSKESLSGVDIVVYDIQDVGARFYTYLSSMHYMMESCAESKIDMIVLDRPNPNGFYVDGPVLDTNQIRSFVGMHPIPIVHGMTLAELALMINNEGWLKNKVACTLKVVPCIGYEHATRYSLPIKPSPNLPNDLSINLYPSLCLFEPTTVSIGRGTYEPFTKIGSPLYKKKKYSFTPVSIDGMSKSPKHMGKECYGVNLAENIDRFDLSYLLDFYKILGQGKSFFTSRSFFNKLAGNTELINQIEEGLSEEEIRKSWEPELSVFKSKRKKYLLYPDFIDE